MSSIANIINEAFEQRSNISARGADQTLRDAVNEAIAGLDRGELRVAEKRDGEWVVNQWLKKAVLLSFALNDNRVMEGGWTNYYDKVEPKFAGHGKDNFSAGGMRVVPPAMARYGSYVAPNVVLMPSYVNIGAYVDSGTMVDTWATVGSCAQVGKNVHLSGGVGLGESWSRCRPTRPSSRTIALSARARRLLKVSWSAKVPSSPWGYTSARAPGSTTGTPREQLRQGAAGIGGGIRQPALKRRQIQPVLRGHRQTGR